MCRVSLFTGGGTRTDKDGSREIKGKFLVKPSVFVTAEHHHSGLKRDAASVWVEDVNKSSFKVCLRELENYAGSHENLSVNWLAFTYLHKPPFSEHNSIYFVNNKLPADDHNNAFCKL